MRWSITSGLAATSSANISARFYLGLPRSRDRIGNESVPIQLAQCRFFGLAISDAKILTDFFQIKYTEAILSNSTRKLSWLEITKMLIAVWKWIYCVIWYNCRPIFVPCWQSNWMRVIREKRLRWNYALLSVSRLNHADPTLENTLTSHKNSAWLADVSLEHDTIRYEMLF